MKLVYICSRYKPDENHSVEFHRAVAATACRIIIDHNANAIPVAPHLYFPQFMDDENQVERKAALTYGNHILKQCHVMKVIVVDNIISDGMKAEIELAEGRIPVDYIYATKEEMEEIIEKIIGN